MAQNEEEFTTEEVFNSAVSIVRNLPKEGAIKPSDELKLKLYAYFKQAVHGPNDTPKPRFYQLVELYKWDAWRKLGEMSKEAAMLNYIGELKQIMESIPEDSADPPTGKEFEDALGKKFYDYWFRQWKKSDQRQRLSAQADANQELRPTAKSNDTQSNSSEGSSMSLLEESQSMAEGYKTPTSLAPENAIVGQASDQYAAAILRLQQGLDDTNSRLSQMDLRINRSIEGLRQHEAGRLVDGSVTPRGRGRDSRISASLLISMLKNIKSIHWFYLCYPVLIYFVMRSVERKSRRNLPR